MIISFFMPLSRHLRKRQAWHCRRVFRVISQVPLRKGHLSRTLRFMALLKKPLHPSHVMTLK
jgi:hypothetical protein